ncbi:hypothetical protein ACIQ7Q_15595 [Streptomyces sp. NPDC096176]|uniref:hypothetical protein n=1 Tax=Streptomyces sp. NPDC096176 TaxID=3366079 RepID=UPI00380345A5
MGISDQFKDKAQELAEQAKQKAGKGDPSQRTQRGREEAPERGRPGREQGGRPEEAVRERGEDAMRDRRDRLEDYDA